MTGNSILFKVLSILRTFFAIFVLIAMCKLWSWNAEGVGIWFAICMIILGAVATVASIYSNYLKFINPTHKFKFFFRRRK